MTTIAPVDHTMTCDKCGNTLIVPKWSEYVSDGLVLNFWYCSKCGCQFETEFDAFMPADADSKIDSKVLEEVFPSLILA